MTDVSYEKLWRKLDERGLLKTELIREAKITSNSMARLGKDEDVRLNVLVKLCRYFDCRLDDLVDILPEGGKK
jgi:DNA-binding Xre family transcriptional regulator